jgi:ADP-ribose pyrophosphatase YjhB (NUDIX family)
VKSKFQWAQRQIILLDLAITDYVAQKPYVTAIKDEPGAQSYRVTAHLRYPPPASLAHIVSDAFNSLQGTLDYLARELALRENQVPDLKSSFPIIKSPKQGAPEPLVNVFRAKDVGRGVVPMLQDPAVLEILRKVQPYNLPESDQRFHVLQILRTLNGQSKHRNPSVLVSAIADGSYWYTTEFVYGVKLPEPTTRFVMNISPVKDGQEVAFVPYTDVPNSGLPEYDDFSIDIGLEEVESPNPNTGRRLTVLEVLMDAVAFINNEILQPIVQIF